MSDASVPDAERAAASIWIETGENRPARLEAVGATPGKPAGMPGALPVSPPELFAALGLVVLADLTIYRGQGFAGLALLFVAAPFLLSWGAPERCGGKITAAIGLLLLVLAAALTWCGTAGQTAIGFALLVAFAMTLVGMTPYLFDVFVFAFLTLVTGCAGLAAYLRSLNVASPRISRATWLTVVLPLSIVLGFGTLFIFANPNEARTIGDWIASAWKSVLEAFEGFAPSVQECLFWIAAAWIAAGLLRPLAKHSVFESGTVAMPAPVEAAPAETSAESLAYAACRNTLIAVIVLFAAYLSFEFSTLWGRVFPKGFYYAGYAHEGAAWLTVALGLATAVLSAIFRGAVLRDPQLPRLRRLAWIWSAENLLLAVAVYHRMLIYIDFNGMTRMRTVGLLGMTAVVVGFVLVIRKITHRRDFVWLLNRQVWTLAAAIYLYAVLPVDAFVHTYNVRRILAGDSAPSVQISVHPIDTAGVLVLHPLVNCDDPAIREGIRALLAERAATLDRGNAKPHWTGFQLAESRLRKQLDDHRSDWSDYTADAEREVAWKRFREYAYQWY